MIGSTLERSICSWIVSLLRPQSPSPQTAHEPRKQDRLPGRPSYCLAATQPPDGERPALPGQRQWQRQWQRQEQNIFCFPIEGRTLDPGTISTLCLTDLAPRPHGRPIFMLSVQLALIARPGRSPPRRVALVPLYDAILSPVASWGTGLVAAQYDSTPVIWDSLWNLSSQNPPRWPRAVSCLAW